MSPALDEPSIPPPLVIPVAQAPNESATPRPAQNHRMKVNMDYTGLEISVTKGSLKGLQGMVVHWNETAPLPRAVDPTLSEEKKADEREKQVNRLAVLKARVLENRYALRFRPSRTTEETEMDVMLSVRLENRVKLDQIPGHHVVER